MSGRKKYGYFGIFPGLPGHTKTIQNKEVLPMSKQKKNKNQGRDLRGSAPIAGQNRTDTAASAQDPMADKLEMRMKREGHDM